MPYKSPIANNGTMVKHRGVIHSKYSYMLLLGSSQEIARDEIPSSHTTDLHSFTSNTSKP